MAQAALVGMVVLMVTGIVPTVIAALIAAADMVLGGCLSTREAYRSISWSSVVLIAAMIPMGRALETTGGASLVAEGLVNTLGDLSPVALMAGVFLLTTGFSQVISNTATAVLVAPIVMQAAVDLGVPSVAATWLFRLFANSLFRAENSLFGSKNSLLCRLGNGQKGQRTQPFRTYESANRG